MKSLSAFAVIAAASVISTSAFAVDVCGYVVSKTSSPFCPVRPGTTICIPVSAKVGPCDANLQCFGIGVLCNATLIRPTGPQAKCPFGSRRATGLSCFKSVQVVATATPAPPPSEANKSGPIAVTADGQKVVAANTDTDTVSFFEVGGGGLLTKVQEVSVGDEPRSVATLLNTPWAYVANSVSGTVSVLNVNDYSTVETIDVGTEPQAVVASPNGHFVYVANASDNTVQVIDTSTNDIIATIAVGRSPRALAITNDGDGDDLDELLYVPNFFARPRTGFMPPSSADLGGAAGAGAAFPMGANGQPVVGEGIFDDSREAVVDVISAATNVVVDQVVLGPIANTGFNFARGAFDWP